ncbi:hypothetical protein DD5_49 [Mycobacterium phage DD5]|uniref:Uncharacterized protein n=1 Tax=Mycobacterium phage DD5 TaxID=540064 RepID=B3VH31_9CAUD|nr:hypothetical protein DD5_49 [Mycobacterium phage DD5]ACE80158.1 hypothetical protein DD5_49 [Mycobacterium phage DD5]
MKQGEEMTVTGPSGLLDPPGGSYLSRGDLVRAVRGPDLKGVALVERVSDKRWQYIKASSLTSNGGGADG